MRTIIYAIICVCLLSAGAVAQHLPAGSMGIQTLRDGLAGASVTDILADDNGVMWVATSNGVNTYNGKRLATLGVGNSTQRNPVYHIYKSPDHYIYALSHQGIFRFASGQEEFERVLPQIVTADALLPLGRDSLIVGNREGLHFYDGHQLRTYYVGRNARDIANSVHDISSGNDGQIWFISKHALHTFSPKSKKLLTVSNLVGVESDAILSQIALCGNKCYIGTKNYGLFVVHIPSRTLKHIDGVGDVVSSLRTTSNGLLCIGTDGSGACMLNPLNDSIVTKFSVEQKGRNHIRSNSVNCYFRDKNDVDWFGFSQYGLSHTFHSENLFKPFCYKGFTTQGLLVLSYLIEDCYCLIGTDDGFYFIDRQRDQVKHISANQLGDTHIVTSIAHYNDRFYIGSINGGVRQFDPKTMAISKLAGTDLDHFNVTQLIVNPVRGTLNIGTGNGLFVLRPNGEIVTFNEVNSNLGSRGVTNISFNSDGNSWLSSSDGLTFYIQANDQFISKGFPSGFFNHVGSLRGCAGHNNMHFFYCADSIYYTDDKMQNYGVLDFPPLLNNEISLSFVDDMRGNYWVNNERGLFCIDYGMHHIQYLGEAEGIACQNIREASLQVDKSGLLWVGTTDGLFYASLADLEKWKSQRHCNILLYNIQRGEDILSESMQLQVNDHKTLSLTWNFVSQKLQAFPVVLDYSRSHKRFFEYKIDKGNSWTLTDDNTPIVVDHLGPGRHLLHIRLSGLPSTEQVYTINVIPSAAAIIELVLLVAAIALLVWLKRYRKNTQLLLEERDAIEDALIEVETGNKQGDELAQRQKYDRVRIKDSECQQIVLRLREYLESSKVYLNPELKMNELAEKVQISPSKLSQVLNLYLNESYYEFINNYRLEEFKRRIEAGDAKRFTLIALSEKCGFKKSSFFATFRRVEGMTPTEYLKKTHRI